MQGTPPVGVLGLWPSYISRAKPAYKPETQVSLFPASFSSKAFPRIHGSGVSAVALVEEVGRLARDVNAALVVPFAERAGSQVVNSVPIVDLFRRLRSAGVATA